MPSTANFKKVPISNLPTFFNFQNIKIGFDKITGSINYLMIGNNVIATTKNPLLLLEYRTYVSFCYDFIFFLFFHKMRKNERKCPFSLIKERKKRMRERQMGSINYLTFVNNVVADTKNPLLE